MKKIIVGVLFIIFATSLFTVCACSFNAEERLCYYNQELYLDSKNMVLDGKQTVGFYNYTDNVLEYACMHLYPNAFRQNAKASVVSLANYEKAYPNGKDYGNIQILSVESGDEYLDYVITGEDENILKVDFKKELYPDELIEFEIGFSVNLANINHRLGYGDNTINLCNYYPVLCVYEDGGYVQDLYHSNGDPFYSKVADFSVSINYDEDYVLACTGEQSTICDNGLKDSKITAHKTRDFAMVLSKKFKALSQDFENTKINYYYYNDQSSEKSMQAILNLLKMNKKYGAYPYSTLSVCESNFVHGGMEYPGIVLISDMIVDHDTYINVIVHELCHQWWYGVVGNNQYKYGFLDEGLTDFNTALFYDEYPEYNLTSEQIFNNALSAYTTFTKVYSDVYSDFSTKMARPLNEFSSETEYAYLCYTKSMLMFASLKDMIGIKKINKCMSLYYEKFKFKEATPQDLVNCFSKASGKNLNSFFNSWFEGNVVISGF